MSDIMEPSRRQLLATAAAITAVTLFPGATLYARSPEQAASSKERWGLLIDTTRCSADCTACVGACSKEFGLIGHDRPASDPQWIRKVEAEDKATGRKASFPVMCQHCAKGPCIDVCPTGASFKRADGVVLVNRHLCIGCRYCMVACPYKARSFVHETVTGQKANAPRGKGTVEACTLCVHRIDAGRIPACAEACAKAGKGAILFGDLNDPGSQIAKQVQHLATRQLRADLGTDPAVRYQGL